MNNIKKIISLHGEVEQLIEDTEGAEIYHKGCYGTIMSINIDCTAMIYLEREDGSNWQEEIRLSELVEEF